MDNEHAEFDENKYDYEQEEEEEKPKVEEEEEEENLNEKETEQQQPPPQQQVKYVKYSEQDWNDVEDDLSENEECVESECSDVESSDNEETIKNQALINLLLQQLNTLQKDKEKKAKKSVGFTNSIKKFLKLDMQTRAETINERHIHDFLKLSNAIIQKRIKIPKLNDIDRVHLKRLVSGKIPTNDRKLILIEDTRLHTIFYYAIKLIEKEKSVGKSKVK